MELCFLKLLPKEYWGDLEAALARPNQVNILDGLQRTYILNDLVKDGHEFLEGQTLLVEFWLESLPQNLIYRLIVLNAGQKPMSVRHQIDVLFSVFKKEFELEIDGLEIFVERMGGRRVRPRKYALDRVVAAYQSFLSRSPEVKRENIVAQQLQEEEILVSSEEELKERLTSFKKYLAIYANLDDQICRVYSNAVDNNEHQIPTGLEWFGSENVMVSLFAAIARTEKQDRVDQALNILLEYLVQSKTGDDPLGLDTLRKIERGINPRKGNVGVEARKILFTAFREYFRDAGDIPLMECWVTVPSSLNMPIYAL
jgi:hypothetical protein